MSDITQKLGFDASGAQRSLTNLTKKLNEANGALAKFQGTAGSGGTGKVDKSLDKTKKKANELTVSWKTMVRVIQTQMIVRGLNAIVQSMKEGVESARTLGLAIEEVQTISGRPTGSDQLTKDIIELSNALSSTPEALAEGLYQTLSNQVVEVGEALEFTANASRLATITASETGDAVNALSSVMNSYGLEAEQAEHVSGTLFKTVELGRIRLSEIANVIGRVTPLTAAMGVTWEETAASLAVMTRSGVRADTAITQLRAVMTKLIKPTDEVRAIFRKWGVEDGKQAIETFGGLAGVLKKLSEEVGGTTEGMADLLRRVRAIAGQMGIMVNDGADLAEAMEAIANATEEATDAWDDFSKSDAHKLTLAMQEFENKATTLGTKIIPSLTLAIEASTEVITGSATAWDLVTGGISTATIAANTYAEEVKKGEELSAAVSKKFAEEQRTKYKGLIEAASKYYTVINKEEFTLAAIRDDSITQATAALEAAGKQVIDFYASSIKALDKTLADSKSAVLSNAKEIANLQGQINDRRLAVELGNAKTNSQKLFLLDQKIAEARAKFTREFGRVDATKESKERAINASKQVTALEKQALAIAVQGGHRATIDKHESNIQASLTTQQRVLQKNTKSIKQGAIAAERERDVRKDNLGLLKELVKEQSKLRGQRAGADPTQATALDARLEEIGGKITDILSTAENGGAFLRSLGLDKNFDVISAGLRDALNQADIDWKRHVAEANKAFARATIPLRFTIDPSAGKDAEALGLVKSPKETEAGFKRRTDERSLELLKQRDAAQKNLTDARIKAGDADRVNQRALATSTKNLNVALGKTGVLRHVFNTLQLVGLTSSKNQLKVEQKTNLSIREKHKEELAANTALKEATEITQRNGILTEDQITKLKELTQTAFERNQLTTAEKNVNLELITGLEKRVALAKQIKVLGTLVPDTAQILTAEKVVGLMEERKEVGLDNVQVEREVEAKVKSTKATMDQLLPSTTKVSAETANTAAQAGAATTNVAAIGTAAGTASTGVGSISVALDGVIAKAKIAAAAVAAIGSGGAGAVSYHGGPMSRYFAAGGSPRGQDKISTMLSRGETVVNSKNSKRFYSELNAMNQGSQPVFREQGGQVTNVGDVNVTVNGGDSSQQTVREIGHALRREVQRGNIKLH